MRYSDFKIVETKLKEAGEVYVIGDSHAKAMGGSNNLAANGARLSAIARQANQVPDGATVYMTGGHNDVTAGSSPQNIANAVASIINNLKSKDCTVNYILFPEGSQNENQENMAPTRQAVNNAVDVARDLDGCSMQSDGIHCSLGSYRGIVNASGVSASSRNEPAQEQDDGGLQSGPPYPEEDMDAVKALQSKLQELGYSVGSTGVDGKYGPRTTRAVRAFKKDNNISGDGLSMSASDLEKLSTAKPVENPTPTGASAPGGELGQLSQDSVTRGKVGQVLDLIAGPESGGRYDAVYPGRRRPQILDMTLSDLFNDMRSRGRASGSSASGRYQYIRRTLQSVTRSMGLNPDTTKFTPETQDEIVIYHLRRDHGLDRWLAGRMSDEDFLNRLARTWAGIPQVSGGSYYAGVLDNRAGMSARNALAALGRIQQGTSVA